MTFGEQVGEADAHAIIDRAIERGVNFMDTAEMYSVPTRAETYGATEAIIGRWLARRPGLRGAWCWPPRWPAPRAAWTGCAMARADAGRHRGLLRDSLKRLQTDVIDLYQIHWPERHVPAFGIGCTTTRPRK
jgi:aryl-alcohol dehydrogenase-like predicted oxidoreductase